MDIFREEMLMKEFLLEEQKHRVLVRYTLTGIATEISLKLQPFPAFRNRHCLSWANGQIGRSMVEIFGSNKMKLYPASAPFYVQLSNEKPS